MTHQRLQEDHHSQLQMEIKENLLLKYCRYFKLLTCFYITIYKAM